MVAIDDAGTFRLGGRDVMRMGYGAMQLAGPHAFGPPRDRAQCVAVLREAVAAGVDHIDTSDYYGPYVTNEILREALHPYPDDLVIVTKIGARRGADGSWNPWAAPADLRQAVHDNLGRLGLERIEVVNLRIMGDGMAPSEASIADRLEPLVRMKEEGLVGHIGLSNITLRQLEEGLSMTPIACVQNLYNLARRADDPLLDVCTAHGIAFVPFFPLGGLSPLQSATLSGVAERLGHTPLQVALAWLLRRAKNVLLIPGTSSPAHLRENLAAASLTLPADALDALDGVARAA